MNLVVDVDDPSTWPLQLLNIIDRWAEECRGTTKYTNDLDLALEDEAEIRELLAGHLLRAYHCTRLLPHEVRLVEEKGLRLLSPELLFDRIKFVQDIGAIDAKDANELHAAHVFATGEQEYRENQVCLIFSKTMFRHMRSGCKPLLENWGGEGIYRSSKRPQILDHLNKLSKPTVVVALLDFGERKSPHSVFPALHKLFVGTALGLLDVGADVFYKAPVPPEHIECILQPGQSEYELLVVLPK